MSILHHQISPSLFYQFPPRLTSLSKNALAFDLTWGCWLYYRGGPLPNYAGLDLSGRDLQGACLWRANLQGTNFQGANLSGADLSGANLFGSTLFRTDLRGAYRPTDPPSRLEDCEFSFGERIIMSLLHRQVLRSQVHSQLYFLWEQGSSLAFDLSWPCWTYYYFYCYGRDTQPNFSDLNLSGRDLQGAFLWGANLSKTNLSKTNLSYSNLSHANFSGTDLSGADLVGKS